MIHLMVKQKSQFLGCLNNYQDRKCTNIINGI
jgi:hypothetical protein